MRLRIAGIALVIALTAHVPAFAAPGVDKPSEPYIDKNVCPFEDCNYGHWIAKKDTQIFDAPEGKVVGTLKKNDGVEASPGEILSWPLAVKATHAIPYASIQVGDTYYVLHYEAGEGSWKIWFKGQVISVDSDDIETVNRKTEWWVKVRTANGTDGWVLWDENFSDQNDVGKK